MSRGQKITLQSVQWSSRQPGKLTSTGSSAGRRQHKPRVSQGLLCLSHVGSCDTMLLPLFLYFCQAWRSHACWLTLAPYITSIYTYFSILIMRLNLFFLKNYLFMIHREIRLSLNISNSHCLVNSVICTHLWCLGCCLSCRSRCADVWDECWQRRAAGGRIGFQDQTWQKFSHDTVLKNKISCGILIHVE